MTEPEDRPHDETVDLGSPASAALNAEPVAGARQRSEPPRSSLGDLRPVILKEAEGESSLVVKPTSDAMPSKPEIGDRYQLSGEIARGGMGAVLRGRDVDLGRDLAVKVLLEKYTNHPEIARRFVEEAQIGGQLQHPGVVPIYDIGRFGERPFFTMKLVKGQTLAVLLSERTAATEDRPRLLGIALQVAQAMAYAHAKGVIHRDLKPPNIMVGAFGEVQVMDWGLAKVLAEGGNADEARAVQAHHQPEDVTTIRTARSTGSVSSFGTETEMGSLLGTPAYMPPEQANGDVSILDRRADVFGLGAILCEILTGKPPYVGRSVEEVRRKACNGDLAEAITRLDASGADAELLALTKKCLSPEAIDRPHDAQEVADELSAYLNGVQERLQTVARERAVAEAQAIEERRRRKIQLALTASLLAFLTLGGLSTTYFLHQRAEQARLRTEQTAAVDRVVGQAVILRDQAREAPEDVGRWQVAMAAVTQAEAAQDELAAPRLRALRDEIQTGLDAAHRDKTLLDRLVDIRSSEADDPDGSISDADYAEAFRDGGIDVEKLSPVEAGEAIKARIPSVARALAGALDDWAAIRRDKRRDAAGAASLSRAAKSADPDPWRTDLRTALDEADQTTRLTRLRALEKEAKYDELGPISLHLLGSGLLKGADPELAESVLRKAQERHPRDVWINYELARACEKQGHGNEAIRFFTAARAIRPETAHDLAHSLEKRGDRAEAIAVFRDLQTLRPSNTVNLHCLGRALQQSGQARDAEQVFDIAIVAAREETRLNAGSKTAHSNLGKALSAKGQLDEAIACYRKAIEIEPKDVHILVSLNKALRDVGELDEALAVARKAVEYDPKSADAHNSLGQVLNDNFEIAEAIACYRMAIELDAKFAPAYANLGLALPFIGQLDEAIACCRKALELEPTLTAAHINLGLILGEKNLFDEAIACYTKALEIDSRNASALYNLGLALKGKGQLDEAIASHRKAVEFDPKIAQSHVGLGIALQAKGQVDEAIACYRKALKLKPKSAEAYANLGLALQTEGRLDEALACFQKAIELAPRSPFAYGMMAAGLLAKGRRDEAVASMRKAVEFAPHKSEVYISLGSVLIAVRQIDEGIISLQKAVELAPQQPEPHNLLGLALMMRGRYDEAKESLDRALERFPPTNPKRVNTERLSRDCQRLLQLQERFPRLLSGEDQTASTQENLDLVRMCQAKRLYAAATRFAAAAFSAEPQLTDNPYSRHVFIAACCAALAAAGQGEDAAQLDEAERARLRQQAREWIRAELTAWEQLVNADPTGTRQVSLRILSQLPASSDLASIRDAAALAQLSADEQQACTQLWADVATLMRKVQAPLPKAPPSLEQLLAVLPDARTKLPGDSPQLAGLLAQIGQGLLEQQRWTEAETHLRECLAIREKTQPEEWNTFNTRSALGGSLLGQKKYVEAEPLLLAGYEGLKARETTIPEPGVVRLPEAIDRLINFYTATDRPDEVQKWQAERAKYPPAAKATTGNEVQR